MACVPQVMEKPAHTCLLPVDLMPQRSFRIDVIRRQRSIYFGLSRRSADSAAVRPLSGKRR